MKCKVCGIDGQIMGSRTEVTGDKSPDTVTQVFSVLESECVNPQCENDGKSIGEERILVFDGTK